MTVNIRYIILEIIFLVVVGIVERLAIKTFGRPQQAKHLWWIWTFILWVLIIFNLGYYWPAYPLALWMIFALILIFIQISHNHEFLYRRYWPVFWRFSAYYALLVYFLGLMAGPFLPLG